LQSQLQKGEDFLNHLNNLVNTTSNFTLRDASAAYANMANTIGMSQLIEPSSLNYVAQSYNEKFLMNTNYFPLPLSNLLSSAANVDLKIMYQILTSPNYGFLGSENFGSKKIFHVGVSLPLLQQLYKDLGEKSNLICLIVERKNNIDLEEKTLPKYFIYDTSKFIIPKYQIETSAGPSLKISNHLTEYSQTDNFQSIIEKIEMLELVGGRFESLGTGRESIIKNTELGGIVGNYSESLKEVISEQIHINHILDYYLKLYTKSTVELSMKECNFPIKEDVYYENTIDDFAPAINFYTKVRNNIKNKIDSTISPDEDTIAQLARAEKIVKTSAIFNSNARAQNSYMNTGTFSRVFSFLINDGDFIKHEDLDEPDINYPLGSKLLNNGTLIAVENSSIYSFNIKVGIIKRW
jgi:hypothetical protein